MNDANLYTVKNSKILQLLLAVMENLVVDIKLIINQTELLNWLFFPSSRVMPWGDLM